MKPLQKNIYIYLSFENHWARNKLRIMQILTPISVFCPDFSIELITPAELGQDFAMNIGSNGYSRLSQDEDGIELELKKEPRGIYFSDGMEPKKRIDYVLVYETNTESDSDDTEQKRLETQRQVFEDNLRKEGLSIEYDELISSKVCVSASG